MTATLTDTTTGAVSGNDLTEKAAMEVERLRDLARQSRRRSYESFERCDTDGFLTQWGADLIADEYDLQADLLEDGGRAVFLALFDLAGELVPAKLIDTRYGRKFALLADDDPDSDFVGWFGPSKAATGAAARRSDAARGYYVGYVKARAKAKISGSSMVSCRAVPVRTDGGFSRDVTVVDNGHGDDDGTWYLVKDH